MEEAEDDLDEDQAASADQKVTPPALGLALSRHVHLHDALLQQTVRVVEARCPDDGCPTCNGYLCHNCPGAAECDGTGWDHAFPGVKRCRESHSASSNGTAAAPTRAYPC